MFRVKADSREIDLCASLVSVLFRDSLLPLQRVRGTMEVRGRQMLSLSHVDGVTPVRGVVNATCDEHGTSCP